MNHERTTSPVPAKRHRVWFAGPLWVLAALLAVLPVAAIGYYSYRLTEHSIRSIIETDTHAAAVMAADGLKAHLAVDGALLRTVTRMPAMEEALRRHDESAVRERLKRMLTENATIDRAYVLDEQGILWSDWPVAPESLGKKFDRRDYFSGAQLALGPYVSEVFLRAATPRMQVIAVSLLARPAQGGPGNVLVVQHRLWSVTEWLSQIELGSKGYVVVLDKHGAVVGHPRLNLSTERHEEYSGLEPVKRALKGETLKEEYVDPVSGRAMISWMLPVETSPGTRWVIIAQQDREEALGPLIRLRRQIVVAAGIVAILAVASALALARVSEGNRIMRLALAAQNEELEKAFIALKQAQGQLVQSEKLASLGQMVAGVAHEINNPLSFVANNVAVMQRDLLAIRELLTMYGEAGPAIKTQMPELAARIEDLAERIDLAYTLENLGELTGRSREGLKRIEQIVKDLRNFARLDEADIQAADINAGVTSTANIIQGMAKKKRVAIELRLGEVPLVKCYPAKINQVIMNLLSNAIDASKEGGTVVVGTQKVAGGVQVVVQDGGSGIPPEVLPRIFDPFFTTKPQGQGTGLGLSISYGIVQQHGGRIEAASEPGEGARFTVWLPIEPPAKEGRG